MFVVICEGPLDSGWEERDEKIMRAAGRKSDGSSAGYKPGCEGERFHCWYVTTIREARQLSRHLHKIKGIKVYWREK